VVVVAGFWRVHSGEGNAYQRRQSVYISFCSFFKALRFQAAAWIEIGTTEPAGTVARRDGGGNREDRSKGGSDAGASTEPKQGAGALRCLLSRFPLSGSTMSPLRHLFDLLLSHPHCPSVATIPKFEENGCIKCENDEKFDREIRNLARMIILFFL